MDFSALEERYNLPKGILKAVRHVESGGDVKAISHAGAQGPFQFMPATAEELGIDPFNEEQAADGAARYLKENLDRFGGVDLALAAYNAGPGNVEKHGGIPPFKETQDYIQKVSAQMGTSDYIEVEAPDGEVLEFPSSMSDDDILSVMHKEYGAPKKIGSDLIRKMAVDMAQDKLGDYGVFGKLMSAGLAIGEDPKGAVYTAAQGPTFGTSDEIIAKFSAMNGMDEQEALRQLREPVERFREENPGTALSLEGISGIAGGAGLVKGAKAAAQKVAPNVTQQVIQRLSQFAAKRPGAASAGLGGVFGGLYSGGTSEGTLGERGPDIGVGTALGVTSGVVAPVAIKAGASLAEKAAKLVSGKLNKPVPSSMTATEIAETAQDIVPDRTTSAGAEDKIRKALQDDFGDDYESVLQAYKAGDQSLAELYGSRTRTLAKGSAQYGSGREPAEQFFRKELAESPDRALQSINKNVGSGENFYATVDDIAEAGRARARPLYDEAFQANKAIQSKEIDRILETPAGRKALKDSARVMQNDRALVGLPDKELKAIQRDLSAIDKMDEVGGPIASGLNLRTLDAVKKNLDDQIGKLYRSGDKYEAGILNDLKNSLVKAIDDADVTAKAGPKSLKPDGGAYARARAEAGDYLSLTKAMEDGKNFMKLDPELLGKKFKSLSDAEKTAFRSGVGKQVRDLIEKRNEGSNFYNAVFGSRQKQERFSKILSPAQYKRLESDLRAEDRLFKLRNEVLGGSPTASKLIAAGDIGSEVLDSAAFGAAFGPKSIPRRTIVEFLKDRVTGMNDKTAEQISRILYEKDPIQKLAIIESLGTKVLTKEEAVIAKRVYFEALEKIDPYRLIGSAASGAALGRQTE